MKYAYAYKTSDGVRHESALDAASREEVFEELRRRGIRPIKVVAADGSKANGEVRGVRKRMAFLLALCAAALAGTLVYFALTRPEPPRRIRFTNELSRTAYTNLEARAVAVVVRHRQALAGLGLEALTDYGLVERQRDTAPFFGRIKAAYRIVDAARMETRELFRSIFDIFPAACVVEREEAQRLYARTMEDFDASEGRIVKDEKAYRLLVSNYGKWQVTGGEVRWRDPALANEFRYFQREADPSASRWRKDFGLPED